MLLLQRKQLLHAVEQLQFHEAHMQRPIVGEVLLHNAVGFGTDHYSFLDKSQRQQHLGLGQQTICQVRMIGAEQLATSFDGALVKLVSRFVITHVVKE